MNKLNLINYIALFLIIIIILNLGMKLTGYATTTDGAILNITIEPVGIINFSINNISFGSGGLTSDSTVAVIDTLGNIINGTWDTVTQGFRVVNIGNANVTLDLKSGKNASAFIGGTNPAYEYNVSNNETGSCIPPGDFSLDTWYDVNTTDPGTRICDILNFFINNTIDIDIKLTIPSDATDGFKSDVLTATGTTIS